MFNILERMIKQNNYTSIEDMRNKIDVFFAIEPARLTEGQHKILNDMLNDKEPKKDTPDNESTDIPNDEKEPSVLPIEDLNTSDTTNDDKNKNKNFLSRFLVK